jgi:hypothetical protein
VDPRAAETTAAVGHVSETVPVDPAFFGDVPPEEVEDGALEVDVAGADVEPEEQPARASTASNGTTRANRVEGMGHGFRNTVYPSK